MSRLAEPSVLTRLVQAVEHLRDNGLGRFLRDLVFFNRKVIVVEKDLDGASFAGDVFAKLNVEFIELKPELILGRKYRFALRNRYLKAVKYLKRGYGGHAVARDGEILGDIWYYPRAPTENATDHADLRWLGIRLGKDSVYSFDTYLVASARGNNLSAALDRSAMDDLRRKGFKTAFAYYWADNTAAVWNNRVVYRCKELKAMRVHSILLRRMVAGEDSIGNRSKTSILERNRQ